MKIDNGRYQPREPALTRVDGWELFDICDDKSRRGEAATWR